MIYDTLSNIGAYASCHPRLAKAFAYLDAFAKDPKPVGKHAIDGDAMFALVQSYRTNPAEGRLFEAHRKYIDVQWIVSGSEQIGCVPLARTQPAQPYDGEKDCSLHTADRFSTLVLQAGEFAVFFPDDAHMPCLQDREADDVVKVVVKVAL